MATMFLVESSVEMSYAWPEFRDTYLPRLVNSLLQARSYPAATVSVLDCQPSTEPRSYPTFHDAFHDLTFSNFSSHGKITTSRISACIDSLEASKYQNQVSAAHLIIVAATPPFDDSNVTAFAGDNFQSWVPLAQRLSSGGIYCHIAVKPSPDMAPLTWLFEETLRLQGNTEALPYSPTEPLSVAMRISARPNYELRNDTRTIAAHPIARMNIPRRNSYPLDNFYPESFDDTAGASANVEGEQPTLVTQLQQVHGLTKKKVYGAKPVRPPFFSERAGQKFHHAPPLTMPGAVMEQVPSPTAGGRAITQSRSERMMRLSQASPTDHPAARRQHGWPRRGSRLSTPEADGQARMTVPSVPSPGSSSYMSASPVTPVTSIEEVYQHTMRPPCAPSVGPPGMSPGMLAYQTGGLPEGNWDQAMYAPQLAGSYNPSLQTYFPPVNPLIYADSGHIVNQSELFSPPPPSMTHAPNAPLANTVSFQSVTEAPLAPTSQADTSIVEQATTAATGTSSSEDDDERFTFDKTFVAATEELFETEVLPNYPNFPGQSSGLLTDDRTQSAAQSLQSPQAGGLYATREKHTPPQPMSRASRPSGRMNPPSTHFQSAHHHHQTSASGMINNAPYSYSYAGVPAPNSTYASSLTGWAG
ncbi:hypothetical protein CPC08DRAFT_762700 [Agrocybe pediades]|nr:hypothetical protein CPC08DRAFT_762700 [Agrocybe pediades]